MYVYCSLYYSVCRLWSSLILAINYMLTFSNSFIEEVLKELITYYIIYIHASIPYTLHVINFNTLSLQ